MPASKDTPNVTPHDAVTAAVLGHLKETYENAAMVAGWVVVAEFITTDGEPDLAAFAADGLPYWRIDGMLSAAPHHMGYGYAEEEDSD